VKTTGLLIVGHGSRDAAANVEFEDLVAAYRAARPDLEVAHAYVELSEPAIAPALLALADLAERVVALPLFLFAAGHVKNDLPLALAEARRQRPGTAFTASRALGVHPALLDLAFERARSALPEAPAANAGTTANRALGANAAPAADAKTALIVVGRGASDPDANGDFYKLVRLLGEGRSFSWVMPAFIGITRPLFEDTAELVARARPERIVVVPYFLFGGRLLDKLRGQTEAFSARYPWIRVELAAHLGPDARLFALFDERIEEATSGERPLPCDTCQYRVPVSGVAERVGGLQALLWSVRHSVTHTQAMPHVHAHRPLAKHVLVCGNADCADRGSVPLIAELRRALKVAGRERDVRVTRTGCMGRCGEGPTVAVYPDGVWYRGVRDGDAEEIVREHLLGDRLVARLVDNIMQ
jgi:sirohydrochlorin cobaltochelatase